MEILVLNSGSSSLKFQLFTMDPLSVLASGVVEAIGESQGVIVIDYLDQAGVLRHVQQKREVETHKDAIEKMISLFREYAIVADITKLSGVGHRVVHGGESFKRPVLITDTVLAAIRNLCPLAPLHNPANITGIEVVAEKLPGVPQVAVFDTAFHHSIPDYAYLYGLPYSLYEKQHVRRYGFHGTSHGYVSKQAARYLQTPYETLKIITLHLGNGASAAAIDCGKCVDTSMGLTPLEGLVMGTRCGDLDPAILFYLARETGMDMNGLDMLLNKESGLKGICGNNDMRSVDAMAEAGDSRALLALQIFCYRIKKYIGAYIAVLGGIDCLVFTGGIGENAASVRKQCLEGLQGLGIVLDTEKNTMRSATVMEIQQEGTPCTVLVVPTDEELEIANQTLKVVK